LEWGKWRWNELLAVEELFERAPGSVATPRRRDRIGAAPGIDAASDVMGFSPDTKQPNRMLREWEETHARKAHESRVRSAVSTLSATFSGASASRRSPPVKPWQNASASPGHVDPSTPLETARAAYRARPTSSVGSARPAGSTPSPSGRAGTRPASALERGAASSAGRTPPSTGGTSTSSGDRGGRSTGRSIAAYLKRRQAMRQRQREETDAHGGEHARATGDGDHGVAANATPHVSRGRYDDDDEEEEEEEEEEGVRRHIMEGVRRHVISDVRRGGDIAGELARLSLDAGGAPRDDDAMLTGVSSFLAPSPIGVQSPAVDDAFEAYAASLSDRDPESPADRSPAEADTPSPLRAFGAASTSRGAGTSRTAASSYARDEYGDVEDDGEEVFGLREEDLSPFKMIAPSVLQAAAANHARSLSLSRGGFGELGSITGPIESRRYG